MLLNQKAINNMQEKIYKYYLWLCMFLCFFIPFIPVAHALSSVIMGCILVLAIFLLKKKDLKDIVETRSVLVFFAFFTIIIIQSLFVNGIINDFAELRKIGQTILLIVLLSIIKNPQNLKNAFIAGAALSSIISLFNIIAYVIDTGNTSFYTGEIVETLMMTQRLYLGFFNVIALVFCLESFFNFYNKKIAKTYFLLATLLLITTLLIASRTAVILIVFVLISTTLYKLNSKARNIGTIAVVVGGLALVFTNNNFSKRILYAADDQRESFVEKFKTHEPRYLIWKNSFEVFNENNNKSIGLGFGKTQELLREKYKKIEPVKKREWFIQRDFNTHNQYIDFLLSIGVFGLACFIALLIIILFDSKKTIYNLNIYFSLIFFMFFENPFHRTFGVFVIALICYTILNKNKIKE